MNRSICSTHVPLIALLSLGRGGLVHFPPEGTQAPPQSSTPPQPTVEGMRAEFGRLQTEAQGVVQAAINGNRELTADEQSANDTRFGRMESIRRTLDEHHRFASIAIAGGGDTGQGRVTLPQEPGRSAFDASEGRTPADNPIDPLALSDAERPRFSIEARNYAREGTLGPIARRFATITTASQGGLLLPKQVTAPTLPTSINPFRQAHTAHGVTPVETSTTADMKMPVLDADAGGIVAENAGSDTEGGGFTESISLTPKTFESGSMWFSNQLLAANDFNVLQTVVPSLTYNKELGLESAIAAALIADSGITQTVPTASTSTLTYANMVALDNALPTRYNSQKAIVLSKAAFIFLTGLVGSDGHPILLMDPQTQGLARFNGTPVFRSDYLEAFGTTKVVGVVFSLLGFKLRDVTIQNLARYVNYPGKPNQTGLNLFAYHGYGWSPTAVAKLVTPGS